MLVDNSFIIIIMSGSMMASAALKARVRRPALLSKLCKAEDLIHHFPNGSYVGWSGFTGVGAPKLGEFQYTHTYLLSNSIRISGIGAIPLATWFYTKLDSGLDGSYNINTGVGQWLM